MSLHREKAEGASLWLVQCNGALVEGDDTTQRFGNRLKEVLLGQVSDNRVVDLQEYAIMLLTLLQRRFCPFSFGDVFSEAHDEVRHTLGARNKSNVGTPRTKVAILVPILLLDPKLFSFSCQQLG